jgi:sensor histidine kinase regulating citrate/malate metabolism
MYTQHVDSLFNTMKEYQHDFNHHLYTIAGLSSMGLHNELEDYVSTLVSFQDEVNDLVDVNIPALSGLIQSKKSEAREKDIVFEHHFEYLENLNLSLEKVTDIVKVTGNVMDNAFHAVEESENPSKRVTIYGKYQDLLLTIIISNNGDVIPENIRENIFKLGFTTRSAIGGTGVGLQSSNKAVERYRGTITVTSDEHLTTFVIKIPISKKEIHDTFRFH